MRLPLKPPSMSFRCPCFSAFVSCVFVFLFCNPALAQDEGFGIVEMTGSYLPADIPLLNEDSVWVNLGEVIDRPTLLSFVYFQCPGLCSPVMDGIAELMEKSDLIPGTDYKVITIGINYKEPLHLAREKKASYISTMKTGNAGQWWQFFTADSASVKRITDAAGWRFKRAGNDFVHAAGTIMITPKRKISQYFYGTFILPMHFHLAVNDANHEISDASRMKDQKYCYNFSPPLNKSYRTIVSSAAITILAAAVILFIWLSLNPGPGKIPGDNS
jgi:protein SCO1/2